MVRKAAAAEVDAPSETPEAPAVPARTRIDVNALDVGEFEVTEKPVKATLPSDHPLARAFAHSYEADTWVKLPTSQGEEVTKVLRKLATERSLGVEVRPVEDGVSFHVREKRTRVTPAEETR